MKKFTVMLILLLSIMVMVYAGNGDKSAQAAYGFSKETELSFEQALNRVKDELKKEGFGVVSTLDVTETMKKKLDVEMRPYMILGACNPAFAHQAIMAEEQIGLMLPCNVIVYVNENEKTVVAAIDPAKAMQAVKNDKLSEVANEVGMRLKKVIEQF